MSKVTIDRVMADRRAASFSARSIKTGSKGEGLKLVLSMVDLTTLEGQDTPEKVRSLCRKAMRPDSNDPSLPTAAAICVYPEFVAVAKAELGDSGVHVASVATGFPSGQYPLAVRLEDTKRAVEAGADEIDMVISRGLFLAGQRGRVFDEIAQIKEACGSAHLKVILETGELETYDNVRAASDLAIAAGADFVKTSTGKVAPAATMGVTLILLESVRDHFIKTGKHIGVKPAGGIRSAKVAVRYLVMVRETVGDDWLTPELFRFGASTLLNDVLMQLARLRTGQYMSRDDFSEA